MFTGTREKAKRAQIVACRSCRPQGKYCGSGNLVHNLHGHGQHVLEPFDWAVRFEKKAKNRMLAVQAG